LLNILHNEEVLYTMLKEELTELRVKYADERRTEITAHEGEIDLEQMIADTPMAISITKSGYIKSTALSVFRQQHRGGVGVTGFDLKEGDYVEHMFTASKHDYLLFITSVGKIYRSKVYEIPEGAPHVEGPGARQCVATCRGRANPRGLPHAQLRREQVHHHGDPQGHREKDRVRGVQHQAARRRHHRAQHEVRRG